MGAKARDDEKDVVSSGHFFFKGAKDFNRQARQRALDHCRVK